MKMIRIDDAVHEALKQEAQREGRTLNWLINEKLTNGNQVIYTREEIEKNTEQFADKASKLNVPFGDKGVYISPAGEIIMEINRLQKIVDEADTINQDPDYWTNINDIKAVIQKLWADWHKETGR